VLAGVPPELVLVVDVGGRVDHDAQAAEPDAPAELEILLVHEELLGEAAELVEKVAADRHRGAGREGDVAQLGDGRSRAPEEAGPRDPGQMNLVAGRVEELGLVKQSEPGRDDADRGILERPDETFQSPRADDRVGIEEDERRVRRVPGTDVAAAGETEVAPWRDDPHALTCCGRVYLGAAAAVVDDDDLVGLERIQQPRERVPRAVRHDDDGGGRQGTSRRRGLRPPPGSCAAGSRYPARSTSSPGSRNRAGRDRRS
jgi:hypothetical protein